MDNAGNDNAVEFRNNNEPIDLLKDNVAKDLKNIVTLEMYDAVQAKIKSTFNLQQLKLRFVQFKKQVKHLKKYNDRLRAEIDTAQKNRQSQIEDRRNNITELVALNRKLQIFQEFYENYQQFISDQEKHIHGKNTIKQLLLDLKKTECNIAIQKNQIDKDIQNVMEKIRKDEVNFTQVKQEIEKILEDMTNTYDENTITLEKINNEIEAKKIIIPESQQQLKEKTQYIEQLKLDNNTLSESIKKAQEEGHMKIEDLKKLLQKQQDEKYHTLERFIKLKDDIYVLNSELNSSLHERDAMKIHNENENIKLQNLILNNSEIVSKLEEVKQNSTSSEKQLKERLDNLDKEIADVEQKIIDLNNINVPLQSGIKEMENKIKILIGTSCEEENKLETIKTKIRDEELQIEQLVQEYTACNVKLDDKKNIIADLEQDIVRVNEEHVRKINEYKEQISEIENLKLRMAEEREIKLKEQIENYTKRKDELRNEYDQKLKQSKIQLEDAKAKLEKFQVAKNEADNLKKQMSKHRIKTLELDYYRDKHKTLLAKKDLLEQRKNSQLPKRSILKQTVPELPKTSTRVRFNETVYAISPSLSSQESTLHKESEQDRLFNSFLQH